MSPFEHGEVFVLDDGGEVRNINNFFVDTIIVISWSRLGACHEEGNFNVLMSLY